MLDTDTYRTPRRRPPTRFFPLEAEELMRNGQVENATELCKRGLTYFPDNISGYAVLAQAYALLGQEERALNVLENGYRRTGAEGLNMLRLMMRGEVVQTVLEPQWTMITTTEEVEPEAPIAADVADTDEKSEEQIETETESSEPIVIEEADEIESSPPVVEIAEPDVEPALLNESELPEEEIRTEPAIEVNEGYRPEPVAESIEEYSEEPTEEKKIEVEVASEATVMSGADAEPMRPGSIETGEEEPDSGGIGGEVVQPIQETVADPEKPEAGPRETGRVKERKIMHGGLSLHSGTKISRLSSSNLRLIPGLEFAPLRRDDELKMKIAPLINELPPNFSLTFDPIIPGLSTTSAEPSLGAESTPPEPVRKTVESLPEEASPISASAIPPMSFREYATSEEEIEGSFDEVDLFPEIPSLHEPEPGTLQSHGAMTPLEELARRLETARIPIVEEEEERTYDNPAFEPSIISDTFAAILAGQGAYAEAIKAYQTLARMKPERREEYDRRIADIRQKISGEKG